jgi:hypothetical protein
MRRARLVRESGVSSGSNGDAPVSAALVGRRRRIGRA